MKKRLNLIICLMLVCMLNGCGTPKVSLTDEQMSRVDVICDNVEAWSESIYDSGQYWLMNRIHISELKDGTTIFMVGHVQNSKNYAIIFLGVQSYIISDEIKNIGGVNADGNELVAHGIPIDLDAMSADELHECVEQAYLKWIGDNYK